MHSLLLCLLYFLYRAPPTEARINWHHSATFCVNVTKRVWRKIFTSHVSLLQIQKVLKAVNIIVHSFRFLSIESKTNHDWPSSIPALCICIGWTFVFLACRYFLRATISRRLNDIIKEQDIVVHTLCTYPELNSSIKMEVGIEDCLHIEFEYNKSKWVPGPPFYQFILHFVWSYSHNRLELFMSLISELRNKFFLVVCRYHLKDVIVGKIYFLLVRIKIKHMEIDIIKRETTGTGPSVYHENETIAKYEIMDGAPVRGEAKTF